MGPGPTNSNVDNSVIYWRLFGAVSAGHAREQWLTSPKITTLWGHGLGEKWGSEKIIFRKKNFFPATFLHLSQQNIVDSCGLRRQPKHRRSCLIPFPSYWGPKIFAKKILTAVSENLVHRFRLNFLVRLHFTPAYPERRQERFLFRGFWEICPQNLWYEPPLNFWHFGGVPVLKISWLKRTLVQHVVLKSILFTASIYLNPFSRY
jgi:hypothetical protein